jgi:hypothetical protein
MAYGLTTYLVPVMGGPLYADHVELSEVSQTVPRPR